MTTITVLCRLVPGAEALRPQPHAATTGGGACAAQATAAAHWSGTTTLGPRRGSEHGTGIYFACRLSDPTIHFGTAVFDSNFTLDCRTLELTDAGVYTIRWDNGQRTTIKYRATSTVPAFAPAIGTVVLGEFRGRRTNDTDFNVPLDTRVCTEPTGSIPVAGVGLLTIGATPPSAV